MSITSLVAEKRGQLVGTEIRGKAGNHAGPPQHARHRVRHFRQAADAADFGRYRQDGPLVTGDGLDDPGNPRADAEIRRTLAVDDRVGGVAHTRVDLCSHVVRDRRANLRGVLSPS